MAYYNGRAFRFLAIFIVVLVRGDEDFVSYFRSATPEQELSKLPLGSRPAKRNQMAVCGKFTCHPLDFCVDAKPLKMLPAWFAGGHSAAIRQIIEQGKGGIIHEMCETGPFFSTRIRCWKWYLVNQIPGLPNNESTISEKRTLVFRRKFA